MNFYICIPFLCTPKCHAWAPTDRRASELKFKAHCHDRAVCPSCMHTVCNSMYFVRAAAVCTKSKKQKYVIWDASSVFLIKTRQTVPCKYSKMQLQNDGWYKI